MNNSNNIDKLHKLISEIITVKRKPIKCPTCGFRPVGTILYGMPNFTKELEKDEKEGKTIIGGCCFPSIGDDEVFPKWQCSKCSTQFGKKEILDLQEIEEEIIQMKNKPTDKSMKILALPIPPGETIKEQLDIWNISIEEFSSKMQYNEKKIDDILSGEIKVDNKIAQKLEEVLKISADFWLGLQKTYELSLLKEAENI